MPRPTLSDVAQEAGVSLATVDRVMNGRANASPRTRARVLGAARRLGYLDDTSEVPADTPSPVRLDVLLPQGTNAFIHELDRQVQLQTRQLGGVTAHVHAIDGFDPLTWAAALNALVGVSDGVALVAIDHPAVREALRGLMRAGIHVVTLASDIHAVPHLGYVGIDNAQAGRLAGYMLGRLLGADQPAKVVFFAGSLSYRGHQEREMGFRQILAQEFPNLEVVAQLEVQEDRTRAYDSLSTLLDAHPDLAGIYNAGGATAGIARALRDRGRAQDVVFIAHEITEGNKALLLDGCLDAAIEQNPRVEVREALNTLVGAARGHGYAMVPPRLQIVFRENLPVE